MAISRSDCYSLLFDLQENGVDTSYAMKVLTRSKDTPLDVIKFINDNRELDLTRFYEKIRKSYNDKKSMLYKNIVTENEDTNEVLTTLSAMAVQILLFSRGVENKEQFIRHSRLDEIYKVMYNYSKTFDIIPCIKLLRIIKSDIKALESIR